jgi:alkylhydroperoxidase family enzyme
MARLPRLTQADLAPGDRDLLARDIDLMRVLALSPGGARAFAGLGRYIRFDSPLDPRLRELAILQVGYAARSAYEWSHHVKIGREADLSDDDVRAIADETAGRQSTLEPLARDVLAAARELAASPELAPALGERLAAALGTECFVDLVLTIGFYAGVVRVLGALGIEVEPEYRGILDAFPLPAD